MGEACRGEGQRKGHYPHGISSRSATGSSDWPFSLRACMLQLTHMRRDKVLARQAAKVPSSSGPASAVQQGTKGLSETFEGEWAAIPSSCQHIRRRDMCVCRQPWNNVGNPCPICVCDCTNCGIFRLYIRFMFDRTTCGFVLTSKAFNVCV